MYETMARRTLMRLLRHSAQPLLGFPQNTMVDLGLDTAWVQIMSFPIVKSRKSKMNGERSAKGKQLGGLLFSGSVFDLTDIKSSCFEWSDRRLSVI